MCSPGRGINIGVSGSLSITLSTDNVQGRSYTNTLLEREVEDLVAFFKHNSSNFSTDLLSVQHWKTANKLGIVVEM